MSNFNPEKARILTNALLHKLTRSEDKIATRDYLFYKDLKGSPREKDFLTYYGSLLVEYQDKSDLVSALMDAIVKDLGCITENHLLLFPRNNSVLPKESHYKYLIDKTELNHAITILDASCYIRDARQKCSNKTLNKIGSEKAQEAFNIWLMYNDLDVTKPYNFDIRKTDRYIRNAAHKVTSYFKTGRDNAENLLLGIAAAETHLGQFEDTNHNNGHGITQIDNIRLKDIQERGVKYDSKFFSLTGRHMSEITAEHLKRYPLIAFALTRIAFLFIPEAIPSTLEGQAAYWKKHWNSNAKNAKGTVEHYIETYNAFVKKDELEKV